MIRQPTWTTPPPPHYPTAQRGKSGGFRAIYYLKLADRVVLISVNSKTEQADISAEEIHTILETLGDEDKEDEA